MKDWVDYLQTVLDDKLEYYDNNEYSDEYYGLPEYKEYANNWC